MHKKETERRAKTIFYFKNPKEQSVYNKYGGAERSPDYHKSPFVFLAIVEPCPSFTVNQKDPTKRDFAAVNDISKSVKRKDLIYKNRL